MYLLARPDQATQENELELVLYAHEQRRCFPAGSYRASLLEAALWDGCHLFQWVRVEMSPLPSRLF